MNQANLHLHLKRILAAAAALSAAGAIGCTEGDREEEYITPPVEEDLVPPSSGKTDTGYLSTLATELEGIFAGVMRLDVSSMTAEERDSFAEELRGNGYRLRDLTTKHFKFAKKQLNTEALHMNLYSPDVEAGTVEIEGDTLVAAYQVRIESIVSFEELKEVGIDDPAELAERAFPVRLPADPRDIVTRAGESCASGHDPGSLADYNYFYYWDPDKEGCEIKVGEATFTVKSLLPHKTTYPEYDRLTADGRVDVVIFFGAAGHEEEVSYWDWGMREWRQLTSDLRSRGFETESDLEPGVRYKRERGGLTELIDVISPEDLHALNEDTDGIFRRAVQEHEIIIYNGHSFYGSLNVLREAEIYPPDTYQIFFIDSCWSYEYYTRQIFENKITADDPAGWDLADVVNDTEAGWFHNNAEFTRILLTNLLAGAENGGMADGRYYTWANIIGQMNEWALEAWRSHGTETHEIMGVSGVRTNRFDPERPDDGGGTGEEHSYENTTELAIPDNDATGVKNEIEVPDSGTIRSLEVTIHVSHPWIGDLIITLSHARREVVLHDRAGGSTDDIHQSFPLSDFNDLEAKGTWTLRLKDLAGGDTGTLEGWSLVLRL